MRLSCFSVDGLCNIHTRSTQREGEAFSYAWLKGSLHDKLATGLIKVIQGELPASLKSFRLGTIIQQALP